jgi:hypothetical protein
MGTTFPFASFPTAVNCCVAPAAKVGFAGVIAIVACALDVTSTDAVPVMLPLFAVTVFVKLPNVDPAVNRPFSSMVPPPAATDHVGEMVITFPLASVPTAVNCCVPPATMVGFSGVSVIVASVRGDVLLSLPHAASAASMVAPHIATKKLRELCEPLRKWRGAVARECST